MTGMRTKYRIYKPRKTVLENILNLLRSRGGLLQPIRLLRKRSMHTKLLEATQSALYWLKNAFPITNLPGIIHVFVILRDYLFLKQAVAACFPTAVVCPDHANNHRQDPIPDRSRAAPCSGDLPDPQARYSAVQQRTPRYACDRKKHRPRTKVPGQVHSSYILASV